MSTNLTDINFKAKKVIVDCKHVGDPGWGGQRF